MNSDTQSTKKPYDAPQLFTYGDVRQLTQAAGTASPNHDGGSSCGQKPCKTR